MKLRLLWVDDEAKFGDEEALWPEIIRHFLHPYAEWQEDGTFKVNSSHHTASYADIRFAKTFPHAVSLIENGHYDVAILDVRITVKSDDEAAVDDYLVRNGINQGLPPESIMRDMTLAFWLWREIVKRHPATKIFFYTNFAEYNDAFPFTPFMNPIGDMSPAIHSKGKDTLTIAMKQFMERRARETLLKNTPGLLYKLSSDLRMRTDCKELLSIITADMLLSSSNGRARLADLYPDLALEVSLESPDDFIEKRKQEVVKSIEQALGAQQQCSVLARLTIPRFLDWTDQPTYGIASAIASPLAEKVKAWPNSMEWSALELLSHTPHNPLTTDDLAFWEECRKLASWQVDQVARFLKDKPAVQMLRQWAKMLYDLQEPLQELPKEIIEFKRIFRWRPNKVINAIRTTKNAKLQPVRKLPDTLYAGFFNSIKTGLECFAHDLDENSKSPDVFAAAQTNIIEVIDDRRVSVCWIALWGRDNTHDGEQDPRDWPHSLSSGNKLRLGLPHLRGYLITYQFRLADTLQWRCYEMDYAYDPPDFVSKPVEQVVKSHSSADRPVVGYVFVLMGYPPSK